MDGSDVCGWIVDVRINTGGNMWPMLPGLRPMGDGVPGHFAYADGTWTEWSADSTIAPFALSHSWPSVALLHAGETMGSGEVVVVAFRGRPQTTTFGQPTAGLSTANRTNKLSDGSPLILTVAVYADRIRNRYGGTIAPDVPLDADLPEG